MKLINKKRDSINNKQDVDDDRQIVFKKTSSVKKAHRASDPTRPKGGEGSGASASCQLKRRAKPNKQINNIWISEIHFQYSSRCIEHMLGKYNKWVSKTLSTAPSLPLRKFSFNPQFLKYEASMHMKELAFDDDSDPTIAYKRYLLNKINPQFKAFDISFMSKELLGGDIYSKNFFKTAKKPSYSEYLELHCTQSNCSKNISPPSGFEEETENTLFLRFNLEKFNALGKDKYGNILNFRDCFAVMLLLSCIDSPKYFTQFALDFTRNVKATAITLKRTVQLKKMSYSSFYFVLSQFRHTMYVTQRIPKRQQIIIKSIGSSDLKIRISKGSGDTANFTVELGTCNSINNIFLTANMQDIVESADLETIFKNIVDIVFDGGNSRSLLLSLNDICELESKIEFYHHCNNKYKTDAPHIFTSVIELYENKTDPKRYEKIAKWALTNGTNAERKKFKAKMDALRNVYRKYLRGNKRNRSTYNKEFIKALGGG